MLSGGTFTSALDSKGTFDATIATSRISISVAPGATPDPSTAASGPGALSYELRIGGVNVDGQSLFALSDFFAEIGGAGASSVTMHFADAALFQILSTDSATGTPASQAEVFGLDSAGDVAVHYVLDGNRFTSIGVDNGTFVVNDAPAMLTVDTQDVAPACFAAGSMIATPHGEVPVELLRVGDRVRRARGGDATIRWIGAHRVACRDARDRARLLPVRIRADSFGPGAPSRDLLLSPEHAIFADGILIPVRHLVDGVAVVQAQVDAITYYHVEVDRHDLILANGLAVESYLDTGTRHHLGLHPAAGPAAGNLAPDAMCEAIWEARGCAKLRIEGPQVDRVIRSLRPQGAVARDANRNIPAIATETATTDRVDLIDHDWYLRMHPDVARAGLDPAMHYAQWGCREGRPPCPEHVLLRRLDLFDSTTVAVTMADVVAAGVDIITHFCRHGWREGRRPNFYFDPDWYVRTHRLPNDLNPLLHYVVEGEGRGLWPSSHFDPGWYRQRHALRQTELALAHYLRRRRARRLLPYKAAHLAEAGSAVKGRDAYVCGLLAPGAGVAPVRRNSGAGTHNAAGYGVYW